MIAIEEILSEISQLLTSNELKENYERTINYLYKIYKISLKENVTIIDFYISKNQHFVSLKLPEDKHFVNLSVTDQSLEILFTDNSEQMFFFDDENFLKNSLILINSFLKGEYETISYRDDKGYSISKEIKWKEKCLSVFNIKYYTGISKQYKEIIESKGVVFIK